MNHTIAEEETSFLDLTLHLLDHHSRYIKDKDGKYVLTFNAGRVSRSQYIEIKNIAKDKPIARLRWETVWPDDEDDRGEPGLEITVLNIANKNSNDYQKIQEDFGPDYIEKIYEITNCSQGILPDSFYLMAAVYGRR
jgi:hypothetical protein